MSANEDPAAQPGRPADPDELEDWLSDLRTAARRLAGVGVVLMVPLGATLGVTMLVVGRSGFGALVERLVLAVAVSWLVGTALLTGSRGVRRGGR